MDLWAKTIPPALLKNEDIKAWINELEEQKNSIDQSTMQREFADFENLYECRFCSKCMPELDQILYEALFMIFPDHKCVCHQVEHDVLELNNDNVGVGAMQQLEIAAPSLEKKQSRK